MDFKKIIESFNYDVNKEVDIYNQWIFDLNKKEKSTFKETLSFINKPRILHDYKQSYLRNFYYLQLLVELLNRFQKEMKISDESIKYLNTSYEDMKLAFRFQMLWYYNTSWIHLRWFFEKIIHFIIFHFIDQWRLSKVVINKNWIKEKFINKSLEFKINECLKQWDFSIKNLKNEWKDIYNKHYFPTKEVLKLYSHFSYDYVHDWTPTSDIKFDKINFKKIDFLFKLTHIFIWRFIKISIWELIEQHWDRTIKKQIDDYPYYWNYLQQYFWENKTFTNQYSYLYNIIHDDKDNFNFAFNELKLNRNNLFSKEYLDNIDYHNKLWKKAKWNRDKYWELYENDLKKKKST